jgi:hypothetical protein
MHDKLLPPYLPQDPERLYQPAEPLHWTGRARQPMPSAFRPLPFGAIRPRGWLLDQLRYDLQHGFPGVLDQLVPTIFADRVFGSDRRTKARDTADTGSTWADAGIWAEVEMKWWNAEVQGNWWDGYMRTALLTEDPAAVAKMQALVEELLASQDADGYLGIYARDLRFRHSGENGELWALAAVGRALLAWAQARNDRRVLDAMIRAVDLAMKESLRKGYHLFAVNQPWGGITHNIMITDVLVTLHRITGEERFQDYALDLFRQFAEHPTRNDDLCPSLLADPERPFYKHGAHTYEHLRVLLNAWRQSGYPELADAWDAACIKLEPCIAPSGAGIGFEDICGAEAHPETTPAEMCSIAELQVSLNDALLHLGHAALGDRIERIAYNAAPGQRSPDSKGLCYLRCDTAYAMDGREPDGAPNPRFKISPAHQDCAVCCAPNATRVVPYFISAMAAATPNGLALLLHGPCHIETTWNDVPIVIDVETDYPFEDRLHVRVHTSRPVEFNLRVRLPASARNAVCSRVGETRDGFLHLRRSWHEDAFTLDFRFEPRWEETRQGDYVAVWGNLVFARPVPARLLSIKDHPVTGFHDYHVVAASDSAPRTIASARPLAVTRPNSPQSHPPRWMTPGITLQTTLLHNDKPEASTLVPMASSVLRQVHFSTAAAPSGEVPAS